MLQLNGEPLSHGCRGDQWRGSASSTVVALSIERRRRSWTEFVGFLAEPRCSTVRSEL